MKDTISWKDEAEFTKFMFSDGYLDRAVEWIGSNFVPETVFTDEQLAQWAMDNGYVKEVEHDLD